MRFLWVVVVACLFPGLVAAHGSGTSLERTVDRYFIDIGYDPATVYEGDRIVFDFTDLFDAASIRAQATTTVDFDYVWVRLRENGGGTLLATGIRRADFGPTSLLYAVPDELKGELEVYVRYQKGDEGIVESTFAIPIKPYREPYWWLPFVGSAASGAALVAFITLITLLFVRWRNVHNSLVRE